MSLEELKNFNDSGVVAMAFNVPAPDQILNTGTVDQSLADAYTAATNALAVYAGNLLQATMADVLTQQAQLAQKLGAATQAPAGA